MSDPILILGCHRSGTSVVAGLLHEACGVSMGELLPPTDANPLGSYEAAGVVDAHRGLLLQMERDWTCPPNDFNPAELDLTALAEQIDVHRQLPGMWAMKDPRSMFLLPAWAHLGVGSVRLVAVVRAPGDTAQSIEKRDHIRQDRAEAIVDAHLRRLGEIADVVDLPLIRFSSDGADVLSQTRDLAKALGLEWDAKAAESCFDVRLVRNEAPLRDTTPAYDALLDRTVNTRSKTVPSTDLRVLRLESAPQRPLLTHLAARYSQQREELWRIATFETVHEPNVAELILEGARSSGGSRPGVSELHQLEVHSPLVSGAILMERGLRPNGVVAHGLLSGRSPSDVDFFFRSLYVSTHAFSELVVDVPSPTSNALMTAVPAPEIDPGPAKVQDIADQCGWELILSQRVSPGRMGMVFRKRVLSATELTPVVTDLIASVERIHSIDVRLTAIEGQLEPGQEGDDAPAVAHERRRADAAERNLRRLRSRRSVRLALVLVSPLRRPIQRVRTWKHAR
ncbi:hypothetical protein [Ilumatobacter sp.]|uniref:hypothetical protein n=1 Tax=Ilumatobacter sp. TaxID=1967498 RepID=UPI003C4751C0